MLDGVCQALEFTPRDAALLSNRAICRIKRKFFLGAEADATLAIQEDPSFVKGYHRRAQARKGLGEHEAALQGAFGCTATTLQKRLHVTATYVRQNLVHHL